jgi:hypothetical protein
MRAAIDLALNSRRCLFWPDCSCHRKLQHWEAKVLEWNNPAVPPPTEDEAYIAEVDIYLMLSCLSHRCPLARIRKQATVQLLNPFWDGQRVADDLAKMRRGRSC